MKFSLNYILNVELNIYISSMYLCCIHSCCTCIFRCTIPAGNVPLPFPRLAHLCIQKFFHPTLSHFPSLSVSVYSLCSTWRWKAQNKNTFGNCSSSGKPKTENQNRQKGNKKQQLQAGIQDKGRRQKLKLNHPSLPLSALVVVLSAHYQWSENAGKTLLLSRVSMATTTEESANGEREEILTHRFVLFDEAQKCEPATRPGAQDSSAGRLRNCCTRGRKLFSQEKCARKMCGKKGEWIARQPESRPRERERERSREEPAKGVVARM